jgi:hypothetical protein
LLFNSGIEKVTRYAQLALPSRLWRIEVRYLCAHVPIQPESTIHSTKTDQLFRKENETPGQMCFKYAKFRIERVNPFV